MIIQKKPSVNEIVAIRLISGEEIIGRLAGDLTNVRTVTITKPLVVQMQMVAPGQAGIGFVPYMVSVDASATISFPIDKIMVSPLSAKPDIANEYARITTSLALPSAMIGQ